MTDIFPNVISYDPNSSPYFGDGVTYGRELGRVSPEGNVYGQMRFVKSWQHWQWWTGTEYQDVVISGQADSFDKLPTDQPWGTIYQIPDPVNHRWAEY